MRFLALLAASYGALVNGYPDASFGFAVLMLIAFAMSYEESWS